MTEYAMAGNIWSAPILRDYVGWPRETSEADYVDAMDSGDLLIPKFAGSPITRPEDNLPLFRRFAQDADIDADDAIADYEKTMQGGQAACPHLLRVIEREEDLTALNRPWARVRVEKVPIEHPLETKEFLRLRALIDRASLRETSGNRRQPTGNSSVGPNRKAPAAASQISGE